jgi:hypothetical protein
MDFCILEPQWLSSVLRAVITKRDNGITTAVATPPQLKEAWKGQHVRAEVLLLLMKQFELAFELPNGHILIPALLRDEPTADERKQIDAVFGQSMVVAGVSSATPTKVQQKFELSFLPADLMKKLLFRCHKLTVQSQHAVHSCFKNFVVFLCKACLTVNACNALLDVWLFVRCYRWPASAWWIV